MGCLLHTLRHVPWWGINEQPFGTQDDAQMSHTSQGSLPFLTKFLKCLGPKRKTSTFSKLLTDPTGPAQSPHGPLWPQWQSWRMGGGSWWSTQSTLPRDSTCPSRTSGCCESPIRVQSSTIVESELFSSSMVVLVQGLTPKASVSHHFPWYLQCLVLIFRIGLRLQS